MIEMEFERAEYHGTPDATFVGLCDLAERVGAHVEVDVSAKAHGSVGYEYRQVVAVLVRPDDMEQVWPRVTVRWGLADTLGTMAASARAELEAQL